ncbi:nuclear transport factor 2 family protein [Streptomyces sp. NPDC046925]|uniref:nuclear transport factor 2 family protein n=1 Tax=Streptomyces sp. NPDC046925 TaxID=3155375 RepID=UPI0033D826DC
MSVVDVRDVLAPGTPGRAARLPLAPDVVFHSPVADYSGRDDVSHLFAKIGQCLTGLEPLREFTDPGEEATGRHSVTTFAAKVGDESESVYGALVQQVDEQGQLTEATLLLRPLGALKAAVSLMRDALSVDPLPSRR